MPDAQAAYESQMSLWGALMGGCNFILHAAGWMESGLATSYEKFILDIEMLQMFAEIFQPVSAAPMTWRSRRSRKSAREGISSAAHTRCSDIGPPFMHLWYPIGATTELGTMTVRVPPRKARIRSGILNWRIMWRPRATQPESRRSMPTWNERKAEGGAPPVT